MSTISAGTTVTTALVASGDTNGNLVIKTGASATTAATFNANGSVTIANATDFPAGTASAPAITTTGDTDTGIYFPTANQAAITTGGTVAAAFNSNGLFFRNRIINGDMRIDQRNAGASVNVNNFTVDRWVWYGAQTGKGTAQQNAGSVTPPTGFQNYLGFTSSSAYSVISTDYFYFQQGIEGNNVADLEWGTANARTVTLSFWVRSSLTGTFGGSLRNEAADRSYPFSYTISSANTWEQKTLTIAGDTSGTWNKTTSNGVRVLFSLGAGSAQSGTAGAWVSQASPGFSSVTGAVSVVGTNGATFYVTGVQFESGSVATPFERRPYTTELQLCQRYFETGKGDARGAVNAVTQVGNQINFRVTKRASATMTLTTVAGSPLSFGPTSESFLFYGTTSENTATWTAAAEL